jgi:hypothetical protein
LVLDERSLEILKRASLVERLKYACFQPLTIGPLHAIRKYVFRYISGGKMNIKRTVLRSGLAAVGLAVFCWSPSAFADVNMVLTGVTGPSMGGVYTSPYTATINGVNTLIICDDFLTDVSVGLAWTASATNVSSLNGPNPSTALKFDTAPGTPAEAVKQEQDYATAAYLAIEILAQDQNTLSGQYMAGILSYALWDLFDPILLTTYQSPVCNHPYGCLTQKEIADAKAALATAQSSAGSYTQYSNVTIYTPTPIQGASQEFVTVTMSESPSPAILGVYLFGLAGLAFVFRRRLVKAAQ